MRLLECSVPREFSDEYDAGFLKHRRSDSNSVAYFAQNTDDDVMCRALGPDSSSSEDDPPAGGASSRSAAPASHRAANTPRSRWNHEQALGGRADNTADADVCYVCQEPDTPTNVLVGACQCSLKAHQSCHWAWMKSLTNYENEVIIYSRDTCSACKTPPDIAAIDVAMATNLRAVVAGA